MQNNKINAKTQKLASKINILKGWMQGDCLELNGLLSKLFLKEIQSQMLISELKEQAGSFLIHAQSLNGTEKSDFYKQGLQSIKTQLASNDEDIDSEYIADTRCYVELLSDIISAVTDLICQHDVNEHVEFPPFPEMAAFEH